MKFSVIVPVYNVAVELPKTMTSLLAQSFRDFEIVLVDDGSIDGSSALVDSYSNVATVVHQPNSGVVAARQRGFEESKGEWIFFVDGDDRLKPETLASVALEIERSNVDVVQFGYEKVRGEWKKSFHPHKNGTCNVSDLVAQMKVSPLEHGGMCIWNKCYRREIVEGSFADVGDVHISHSEDGLFAFAAFLRAKTISFLPDCFYEYVMRLTSAVHNVNVKIVDEKEQFIARLEKLAHASGQLSNDQIVKCVDFHCYQAACYIFLMLRMNRASRASCLSVLHDLNQARFFNRPNPEWNSIKRKVMRFLLTHPKIYCFWGLVIDLVYARNTIIEMRG